MVGRGYGRIVNVASIAGKEGNPMAAAYSASKAAVIAMTKAIGKDLAETGVLVNCVTPAVIETPMLGASARARRLHGAADPDGRDRPARGGGRADRVSRHEACSFSTGAVFDLSGRARDLLMRLQRAQSGRRLVRVGSAPARMHVGVIAGDELSVLAPATWSRCCRAASRSPRCSA